jgi:hypothetical protein
MTVSLKPCTADTLSLGHQVGLEHLVLRPSTHLWPTLEQRDETVGTREHCRLFVAALDEIGEDAAPVAS